MKGSMNKPKTLPKFKQGLNMVGSGGMSYMKGSKGSSSKAYSKSSMSSMKKSGCACGGH